MCDAALCNRSSKKHLFVPVISSKRKSTTEQTKTRATGKSSLFLVKNK